MNVMGLPPNGLAFSCRERTTTRLQITNDLAREAVSCNAGLGRSSGTMTITKRHN